MTVSRSREQWCGWENCRLGGRLQPATGHAVELELALDDDLI